MTSASSTVTYVAMMMMSSFEALRAAAPFSQITPEFRLPLMA